MLHRTTLVASIPTGGITKETFRTCKWQACFEKEDVLYFHKIHHRLVVKKPPTIDTYTNVFYKKLFSKYKYNANSSKLQK